MNYNKKDYSKMILDAINEVSIYNCKIPTDKKAKVVFLEYLAIKYVNAQNDLNDITNSSLVVFETKLRNRVNEAYFNLNKNEATSIGFDSFMCDRYATLNSYLSSLKSKGYYTKNQFENWEI
jgi:hypothetical protein